MFVPKYHQLTLIQNSYNTTELETLQNRVPDYEIVDYRLPQMGELVLRTDSVVVTAGVNYEPFGSRLILRKHEPLSSNYSFYVSDPKDVDLKRIIEENKNPDILVVADAVFLSEKIRTQFNVNDMVEVGGYFLQREWAFPCYRATQSNRDVHIAFGELMTGANIPHNYRGANCYDLNKLRTEIAAAKSYKRKLKVDVKVL